MTDPGDTHANPSSAGGQRRPRYLPQRVTFGRLRLYNSVGDAIVLGSYTFLGARRAGAASQVRSRRRSQAT